MKYWYYIYQTSNSTGCGVCYSDDRDFDMIGILRFLSEYHKIDIHSIIITNWKEISFPLYDKLYDHLMNK